MALPDVMGIGIPSKYDILGNNHVLANGDCGPRVMTFERRRRPAVCRRADRDDRQSDRERPRATARRGGRADSVRSMKAPWHRPTLDPVCMVGRSCRAPRDGAKWARMCSPTMC